MEQGFFRRLPAGLAGTLLLAGLGLALAGPGGTLDKAPAGNAAWWEVRLVIAAKGRYIVRGGRTPLTGEYTCRIRWDGRLEPDDDDFLLVHLRTEILEWHLRETAGPAGRENVVESAAKPSLRMEYVLKDGHEVEFAFGLGGIPIPLHVSPLAVVLELPRSSGREAGLPGHGYGDFVCRGSSRVVLPETDFLAPARERLFSWDWRREKQYVKEGRVFVVTQDHSAEAAVALTAH